MSPFSHSGYNNTKENEKTSSYELKEQNFTVNELMPNEKKNSNAWIDLHNLYGKKLLEDRKHWLS